MYSRTWYTAIQSFQTCLDHLNKGPLPPWLPHICQLLALYSFSFWSIWFRSRIYWLTLSILVLSSAVSTWVVAGLGRDVTYVLFCIHLSAFFNSLCINPQLPLYLKLVFKLYICFCRKLSQSNHNRERMGQVLQHLASTTYLKGYLTVKETIIDHV